MNLDVSPSKGRATLAPVIVPPENESHIPGGKNLDGRRGAHKFAPRPLSATILFSILISSSHLPNTPCKMQRVLSLALMALLLAASVRESGAGPMTSCRLSEGPMPDTLV